MKLVVTGATGLVGGAVLHAALHDPRIASVVSLGRRQTGVTHPKLTELVVEDFLNLAPVAAHIRDADLCCHCLAAYIHRVRRAAYQTITVGYLDSLISVLETASPGAAFCMFTTEGTRQDGKSWIRTMNVKGQAETRLLASRLPRKYIFRPGYINPTQPRARPVFYDRLMKPVFRLFPAMGIESADLARSMIDVGLSDPRPEAVIGHRELQVLTGL
ncbi:MAG TPA: NAD-dependent epimerase/dehydratase family protein [Thermohalobaculum sp.]|nr:NAD-dependent epimerase/dehydratase family protein [Thermohalobaculum sp.]